MSEAMERAGVKYFLGEVAINFVFSANSSESPSHSNLLKNYIDLIEDNALKKSDQQIKIIESVHLGRLPLQFASIKEPRQSRVSVSIYPLYLYREKFRLLHEYNGEQMVDSHYLDIDDDKPLSQSAWELIIDSAKNTERRRRLVELRDQEKEERVIAGNLNVSDSPLECHPFEELNEFLHETNTMDPKTLIFSLPINDAEAVSIVEQYKRKFGIKSLSKLYCVDINVEIINYPIIDLDNLYSRLVRILKNELISLPIRDLRIYRKEISNSKPCAVVKVLKPHTISKYLHRIDDLIEDTLESME